MAKTMVATLVHLPEHDLVSKGTFAVSYSRRALLFGNGTLVSIRSDGQSQELVVRHVPEDEIWRYSVISQRVEVPVEVYDDAFSIIYRQHRLSRYLPEILAGLPVDDPLKFQRDEPEMAHPDPVH